MGAAVSEQPLNHERNNMGMRENRRKRVEGEVFRTTADIRRSMYQLAHIGTAITPEISAINRNTEAVLMLIDRLDAAGTLIPHNNADTESNS